MQRTQLAPNFYLDEFEESETAARQDIDNSVSTDSEVYRNLVALAYCLLQPARDELGLIRITSGYRCLELNTAIGGSEGSQHIDGCAADIVVPGLTPLDVCKFFIGSGLPVDQCIHEYGQWCHISIAKRRSQARNEFLTAVRRDGKTHYVTGLRDTDQALEAIK